MIGIEVHEDFLHASPRRVIEMIKILAGRSATTKCGILPKTRPSIGDPITCTPNSFVVAGHHALISSSRGETCLGASCSLFLGGLSCDTRVDNLSAWKSLAH